MQLRPDTIALTATLGLLTALMPLSTDMYLASLPSIGSYFSVPPAEAQLTLSIFLIGMVAGQIIYGPLSDSLGRRPVLIAGMILFTGATALCAIATSIEMLIAARFLQATGAAAPVVVARAVVRDLYDGAHAAREMSRIGAMMGLVPAIAPVVGGILEQTFGWRANFIAAGLFTAALGVFAWAALPESNAQSGRPWPGLAKIVGEYGIVVRSRRYRAYVLLLVASHVGLFTYISTATFVLQGYYGISPFAFGFAFGAMGVGYTLGAFTAQRIVTRLGLDGTIRIGAALLAVAGLGELTLMLAGAGPVAAVVLPAMLYTFGAGLVQPQAQAGLTLPHPERAGAAASFAGIVQLGLSSIYGFAMASGLQISPLFLPLGMAIAGVACVIAFLATRDARSAAD